MTGEFWGNVDTSGSCTVMVKDLGPCPAVPGMSSEFSPPNWQPASSTDSDEMVTTLRIIRPLPALVLVLILVLSPGRRCASWKPRAPREPAVTPGRHRAESPAG